MANKKNMAIAIKGSSELTKTVHNISNTTLQISDAYINGSNNDIIGNGNTIKGSNNDITGHRNKVTGSNNDVVGDYNTVKGSNCDVEGYKCTVIGSNSDYKTTSPNPMGKTHYELTQEKKEEIMADMKAEQQAAEFHNKSITEQFDYELAKAKAESEEPLGLPYERLSNLMYAKTINEGNPQVGEDGYTWDTGLVKLTDEETKELDEFMNENLQLWGTW